jgi:hypothetical protein
VRIIGTSYEDRDLYSMVYLADARWHNMDIQDSSENNDGAVCSSGGLLQARISRLSRGPGFADVGPRRVRLGGGEPKLRMRNTRDT